MYVCRKRLDSNPILCFFKHWGHKWCCGMKGWLRSVAEYEWRKCTGEVRALQDWPAETVGSLEVMTYLCRWYDWRSPRHKNIGGHHSFFNSVPISCILCLLCQNWFSFLSDREFYLVFRYIWFIYVFSTRVIYVIRWYGYTEQ